MDLITKEKVYNAIQELEKNYQSETDSVTINGMLKRFKKDLALLKKTIEEIPADVSINETLFTKPKEKEEKYECLLCGSPVSLPYVLCDSCCEQAAKEKETYVKYAMEVSRNEK